MYVRSGFAVLRGVWEVGKWRRALKTVGDNITKPSNEINVWMGDADGTLSHWCFNVREHMQRHIATHISNFFKIT